jgi:hypothetical protein
MEDIIFVGRGNSVLDYDWPDYPIAGISSGIFVKQIPRKPDYFFCLDPPRFWLEPRKIWRYFGDPKCLWWDILATDIAKHVPAGKREVNPLFDLIHGLPGDNLPDPTLPNPQWDEFPNVTTWKYERTRAINWDGDILGGNDWGNSVPFALQIAWRLGFKRVHFAGVEWSMPGWGDVRERMNEIRKQAPLEWPELANSDATVASWEV